MAFEIVEWIDERRNIPCSARSFETREEADEEMKLHLPQRGGFLSVERVRPEKSGSAKTEANNKALNVLGRTGVVSISASSVPFPCRSPAVFTI